jgi:HSP20 family protein
MSLKSMLPGFTRDAEDRDDPFHALRSEIDRVFEGFGRHAPGAWPGETFAPQLDMTESDHTLKVTVELPGMDPEAVDISVEGPVLTIRGEKTEEKHDPKDEKRIVERRDGSFTRTVRLPFAPDPEAVEARFAKGVLTLTMPTPPEARPSARKIAVTTES